MWPCPAHLWRPLKTLSPVFIVLQPHWLLFCSLNTRSFYEQLGLCGLCSQCLKHSAWKSLHSYCSDFNLNISSSAWPSLISQSPIWGDFPILFKVLKLPVVDIYLCMYLCMYVCVCLPHCKVNYRNVGIFFSFTHSVSLRSSTWHILAAQKILVEWMYDFDIVCS